MRTSSPYCPIISDYILIRMTKVSTIPNHTLSITCGLCKHHSMLEVANLILVVGGDATAHDVRQKFRCQKFKAKA